MVAEGALDSSVFCKKITILHVPMLEGSKLKAGIPKDLKEVVISPKGI